MQQQLSIKNTKYVVYDDEGQILSIQNYPDEKYNNLQKEIKEIEKFLNGTVSFLRYKVEYDFIDKDYKLIDIEQYQETLMRESFLYKMPNDVSKDTDITLIQDNKNSCWKLHINPKLPEELKNKKINIDPKLQFYSVTKKNDPNVLFAVLNFDENLEIPFDRNFKFDKEDVSVYTVRKFSTYKHEVING